MKKSQVILFSVLLSLMSFAFCVQSFGQATVSTTVYFTGFQACGGCTLCGMDYWCFNTNPSYCGATGPCGTKTFMDPVPAGYVVTNIQVIYYSGGCAGGALNSSINGTSVPSVNEPSSGCWCSANPCIMSATSTGNFPCGMPGYVYGGMNSLQLCTGTSVCINRIVLVITYYLPSAITPVITPSGPTNFCQGGNVTLDAGAPYSSYTWSTGANTQTINVTTAGTYSVTVSSITGCTTGSASITVTVNNSNTVSATTTPAGCSINNGSATANPSGGTSPFTYLWSNGDATQTTSNLAPGTYTVIATDANGCSASTSVTITGITPPFTISVAGTDILCFGDLNGAADLTISGVGTGISYNWSNGASTEDLSNIPAGTYTVTVTDVNSCTASASVTINQPAAPLAVSVAGTNILCYGNSTGAADLTVSGGTTTYTYNWSNGTATEDLSNIPAGTYSVTVTDANGCTATATVNITQPAAGMTTSITGTDVLCNGNSTGAADLTVNGGTPTYSYNWSNGTTTEDLSNIPAGTYTVTVTDAQGCTSTSTVTITEPASPLSASVTGTDVLCFGNSTGAADLTASGGTATYTYNWSNGASTEDLANIPAGTYTATVTDANGCTTTAAVTINQPAAQLTASIVGTNILCFSNSTGAADLTVSGGTTTYTYNWSNGTATEDLSNITAGTYSVTVTDANGCTATATVNITQPAAGMTSSVSGTNVLCYGNSTGAADLTVNGGTPAYSYNWSNGTTTEDLSNIPAGTYTVTVTDAQGCTSTSTLTITEPASPLSASVTGTDVLCFGNSTGAADLTASGGTATYTYNWSNGAGTEDLANIPAGTYTATVTDANGCNTTAAVTINQPAAQLTASIVGTNILCFGNSTGAADLTVSGGTTNYSYNWSNGTTTEDLSNIAAGTYSVTVTDANGCTATATVNITQPAAGMTTSITGTDVLCSGNSTGAADLTVNGGTPTYSYNWSNGTTTEDLSNIPAGTYTVTVTDAQGCTSTSTITITEPASPLSASVTGTDVLCFGNSTGAADLTASGGTTTYTYNWSNGASTEDLANIPAGTYNATVTDANGCTTTATVTINQPAAQLTASIVGTNILCFSNSTGAADLTVSGGTTNYSYNWSDGTTTEDLSNIPAGTYSVTVTDANGCTATATVNITQPAAGMTTSITGTDVLCNSNSTGAADLTVNGGTPTYSYNWSNGTNTEDLSNIPAGTYTVTVTDAQGCTSTSTVTITEPASPLSASVTGTDVLCFGNSTGAADLTASGGTATYTYNWSNGASTEDLANIPAGTYTATVTDANGCTTTATVTINQPAAQLAASIVGTNILCFGNSTGAADLTVSGGTVGYFYNWNNGTTSEDLSNIPAGTFTVTITDANSCTITSSVIITQPAAPLTASVTGSNILCFGSTVGGVNLTVNGGTPNYSFIWNNGVTTQNLTNIPFGPYTVTVTDANACTASATITISQPAAPLTASVVPTNVLCFGASTGAADLTAAGGTPGYTYSWSNGSVLPDLTNIPAGPYTVTVSDANGCTTTATTTLTQPAAALSATIAGTNIKCFGSSTGAANLTVSGGTLGYFYNWNNGTTSEDLSNIPAGTFTVTVTDANSCTITSSVIITQPTAPLTASVTGSNILCFGSTVGGVNLTVNGGTPNYSFIWNNGATTQNLTNIPFGPYTVTVTDANACTASATITIAQPAAPLTASIVPTNVLCFGASTGAADLTAAGGTPGYTYSWSNGSVLPDLTNIPAGPYTVTVSDANGCTTTATTTLTQPAAALSATIAGTNINCFGSSTGAANLTVSGGTAGYTYLWNNGSTLQNLANIASGIFTVTVSDVNNCTTSASITITQPAAPFAASVAGTNVLCFGGSSGAADLTVSGGTAAYSYLWSNGSTSQDITNITAGVYTVVATDANACTASATVTISQPSSALTASITGTNILCFGGSTGTTDLTVSGGTPGYTYNWSNGSATQDLANIPAGPYTVTVTDANACTSSANITLTEPAVLTQTYITDSVECYAGNNGMITVSPAGGTPNYSYQWNPTVSSTGIASSLVAGTYNVTVTDFNGCSISATITVSQPPLLVLATSGDVSICNGQSTTICASATGGTGTPTFAWSTPGTGSCQTVSPALTTTYSVTATDINGCISSPQSLTVIVSSPISVVTLASPAAICAGSNSSVISATPSGGNGNYFYIWSTGAVTSSFSVSPAANTKYYVTVSDNCGSTPGIDSVQVVVNPMPLIQFTADKTSGCEPLGVNFFDGSSPAIASWLWNFGDNLSGSNTSTLQNPGHLYTQPGTYTVTLAVSTTNGCNGSFTYTDMITVYPIPDAIFAVNPHSGSTLNPVISCTDHSSNAWVWNWDFGDMGSGSDNYSTLQNPQHSYSDTGSFTILLLVESQYGCIDTAMHEIQIMQDFIIYFPNAFTPNENGINEGWGPKGVGIDENNYNLYIFNRWGGLVFETDDFHEYWNGKKFNTGQDSEQGVYAWIAIVRDVNNEKHILKGSVTIVR